MGDQMMLVGAGTRSVRFFLTASTVTSCDVAQSVVVVYVLIVPRH